MSRARQLCAIAFVSFLAASCSVLPPPRPIDEVTLEEEEVILEGLDDAPAAGGDPIAKLISALEAPEGGARSGEPAAAVLPHDDVDTGTRAASATAPGSPIENADTAFDVWSMTDDACREALAAAGIAVSRPDFETPFVKQPLLLDGPIDGVAIRPKWRRAIRTNEVMDCRLIAALRGVARVARELGFSEILFYSTYRPLRDKAKTGKASMHRRGLAVDVGWLTTAEGAAVEVLEGYERHSDEPPCDAAAETDVGRRLRDFACALHARKIFNVVLTPNANKAHHNHFHFDVTPDARWYIIR